MATPSADKLRAFYPSKYLVADGGTITEQTADSGGTTKTIVDAALTEADDYWNGAIGWFEGDTTTAALRGLFFHVMDFTASSDTITLAKNLPTAPVAGDTYRLVLGGNYRGNIEIMGLLADNDQPELVSVTGTNITGLTITKISPSLGTGTLSVFYDQSLDELYIKMGGGSYGPGLDVSGDVTDGIVIDENAAGWIQVDTVAASLPGGDQTDTFSLSFPEATLTPDFEASETDDSGGKIRYRLEVVKNTDGSDTMLGLEVYNSKPAGTDTTIAAGESLGTGAGSFVATSATDWPTASFWVKNTTVNAGAGDCRYVKYRSGNELFCMASSGLRGYSAVSWSAADNIEVMPDVDLGSDQPSTNQFENPSSETTAPGGISFGDYTSASALSLTDLATGSIWGVWRKETIMEGHRARDDIDTDTYYSWS